MVIREYPISEEEKREIRTIFQEKRAITDLISSLKDTSPIYPKLKNDYIETNEQYHAWFTGFEKRYGAKGQPDCRWQVDFVANKVLLVQVPKGESQT